MEQSDAMHWIVSGDREGVLATSTWGTPSYPAPDLVQTILEQRMIRVIDNSGTREKPRYRVDVEATTAAQTKAEEIKDKFAEWCRADSDRAGELARVYNEIFNNIIPRSYDGIELSLPGFEFPLPPANFPHRGKKAASMPRPPVTRTDRPKGRASSR